MAILGVLQSGYIADWCIIPNATCATSDTFDEKRKTRFTRVFRSRCDDFCPSSLARVLLGLRGWETAWNRKAGKRCSPTCGLRNSRFLSESAGGTWRHGARKEQKNNRFFRALCAARALGKETTATQAIPFVDFDGWAIASKLISLRTYLFLFGFIQPFIAILLFF